MWFKVSIYLSALLFFCNFSCIALFCTHRQPNFIEAANFAFIGRLAVSLFLFAKKTLFWQQKSSSYYDRCTYMYPHWQHNGQR